MFLVLTIHVDIFRLWFSPTNQEEQGHSHRICQSVISKRSQLFLTNHIISFQHRSEGDHAQNGLQKPECKESSTCNHTFSYLIDVEKHWNCVAYHANYGCHNMHISSSKKRSLVKMEIKLIWLTDGQWHIRGQRLIRPPKQSAKSSWSHSKLSMVFLCLYF